MAGWLLLSTKQHIENLFDPHFSDQMALDLGPLLQKMQKALKKVTG